ncbi:MAG: TRAP transporter substrate-binding protein DctP [Deltaproteobacteria bacterium]|nr:TRAP transporter substrate-binding protein DctP [Deltaproteobacteria bacterium]
MKKTKLWVIFSLAALFLIGTVAVSFAAAKPAKAVKKASAGASAAVESTRDTRTLFGHNVEGLKPVKIVWAGDSPFGTLGDASLMNFVKLVDAESKGKIKIDVHRFGSLYRGSDFPKVLPIGTIDMAGINKGQLMSRENGYAPWLIGYIWKSPEHLLAVPASAEWYEMEEKLAKGKWNIKPLVLSCIGNWDYFAKKPVTSMKGFGGKKVWTYGDLSSAYINAWGGTPVAKSASEMYMAFYQDALNIISFTIIGILDYKFYEGGKYWVNMPVYPPGSVGIHYVQIYMNRDKWNSLPTAYKKIILDACDLMSWVGTWEILCAEKLAWYRLQNQYKMIDCGISTKYPKEYEKIKAAAVAAGKKFVFDRGATQQQWDEAQSILTKYADPKYTSKYSWWFKLAWAEADRRVVDVQKKLKEGKSWAEAYDPYLFKHRYAWTAEQIKEQWSAVPRVKWEWNEATRLQ